MYDGHGRLSHPSETAPQAVPAWSAFVRRALGRAPPPSPWDNHEPIREELFSVERLEEHARSLAVAQPVTPRPTAGGPLAGRLAANATVLFQSYRTIVSTTDNGGATTPAAEWLIDNYHLVERQIREIRSDLPPGYYRQLPKLADGPVSGVSARVRHCLGLRRAYRQPLRSGDAVPLSSAPTRKSSR